MKNNKTTTHPSWKEKGQSLVEVALFLPIFIVILAGLIEVSQLVITQNRVSQATRIASRFGAGGGQDEGMVIVALNSITQTLQMDEDHWDMWVVRGVLDGTGNGFKPGTWEFTHAFGVSNTVRFSSIDEATIKAEILADLNSNNINAADLQVVGMYALHDVESILSLDALPFLTDLYTIQGFNFMRQTSDAAEVTNGCDAFPIAVNDLIRSVTAPGTGGNPYPNANEFNSPNPPLYSSFQNHEVDKPLVEAQEGYVYRIQNGFGTGNFGWLVWNEGISANANTLQGSLAWPGDSLDYTDHNDGGQPATPLYAHVVRGYVNPYDTSDLELSIGDWVPASTGSINSSFVRSEVDDHLNTEGRTLRLIVWDNSSAQGNNGQYQVMGFAIFRLHGYSLSQNGGGSWILAEFIGWDNSCGQQLMGP